ncbi:MAG: amidohydrolase family protein [Sphaerochaetaceae bacterium]|jgi:predicted TIM-barrel fold metal-dependent hydrolase
MEPIIDTHCHIYPEAIAAKASQSIGAFYSQKMLFDGSEAQLLENAREAGITRSIVSSVATTVHQVASINSYISKVVKANPSCLSGLGTLHPDSPDIELDVKNLIDCGLLGVKIHPDMIGRPIDDPGFLKIFEACSGRLPVLCHFGDRRYDLSNPNRTVKVIRSFPHLQFIGAHFGLWSIWDRANSEMFHLDNLMVDCSSSFFALSDEQILSLISGYGSDRVLFGTDYPMWRASDEVKRFLSLPLAQKQRKRILYENAEKLYGVSAGSNGNGNERT